MLKHAVNKWLVPCVFVLSAPVAFAEAPNPGELIYRQTCSACHATGALDAPKYGDSGDWTPRIKQGKDVLVQHALNGFNAMPAKGGNPALSEADVSAAVSYMITSVKNDDRVDQKDALETQKQFFRRAELGKPYVYPMNEQGYFVPPSIAELPNDKYGDEVRLGFKIFTETQKYAARYAGRGMVCSHCHLDAGRKPHAVPLWGAAGMYPGYRFSSDKNDTLEDRMADCFRNSMNGIAPAPDSPEMRALLAYANYVSKGVPIGVHMPGRSFPDVDYTGYEASPPRGREIFMKKCATCHGEDGQGAWREDGSYRYPPLWGFNSYNKGASLYKQRKLARFIRANMPLGQDFSLTEQEAWDLSSFINMHERPKNPAKGILQEVFGGGH
ncbi:MAG: c-type cytochrome [Gammaproteobacteria bacterium]|nr:c-type cytochrome [Gammaproteobacteria bacterium]